MRSRRSTVSNSPEETYALGIELAKEIDGGEMVLLSGGLGAGKTLLTKGILDGLGFDPDEVTSPSFALVNVYPAAAFKVYHIDLWRLERGGDAAFEVGLEDILLDPEAVVVIEWPDRLKEIPSDRKVTRVKIEGDGDEPRRIDITPAAEALNSV